MRGNHHRRAGPRAADDNADIPNWDFAGKLAETSDLLQTECSTVVNSQYGVTGTDALVVG